VEWDASTPAPPALAARRFDTILTTNVIEHIEDDGAAARHMHDLLSPGGHIVVLVPGGPRLYCDLDRGLGHFRRYTRQTLWRLLSASGFEVLRTFPHNFTGAVGWWWAGMVRKRAQLSTADTKAFDVLVPLLRWVDPPFAAVLGGVSWVAIGRKSLESAHSETPQDARAGASQGEVERIAERAYRGPSGGGATVS
jgi:SAM-dependent methyltransferase